MRILACVDFTPLCRRVLDQAAELARETSGLLIIAHAAAPEPAFMGYDEPGGPHTREARERELSDEWQQMQAWVTELRNEGLKVADPEFRIGSTVDELLNVADDHDVDIIAVGRVPHSRLHDMLVGSTSTGLARRSMRPVLFVPGDED